VTIRGFAPRITGGAITKYAETHWAIQAITEMALGERMIRTFIERDHAGEFHEATGEDSVTEYVIALPGAWLEAAR